MTRLILAGANTRKMLSAMPVSQWLLESFVDTDHRNPLNENRNYPWVLDCGAFTAYRQGKTIDLEEYADYTRAHHYEWCLSVDVIDGGPADNAANFDHMISLGVESVPVWHEGEPTSLLSDYCAAVKSYRVPLVAIGTQWPRVNTRVIRELDAAFTVATVPIHGLALVSYGGLYPFTSVDSRTWASACAKLTSSPWISLSLHDKISTYTKAIHASWAAQRRGTAPPCSQGVLL